MKESLNYTFYTRPQYLETILEKFNFCHFIGRLYYTSKGETIVCMTIKFTKKEEKANFIRDTTNWRIEL